MSDVDLETAQLRFKHERLEGKAQTTALERIATALEKIAKEDCKTCDGDGYLSSVVPGRFSNTCPSCEGSGRR